MCTKFVSVCVSWEVDEEGYDEYMGLSLSEKDDDRDKTARESNIISSEVVSTLSQLLSALVSVGKLQAFIIFYALKCFLRLYSVLL
jgi:hypothetical protein